MNRKVIVALKMDPICFSKTIIWPSKQTLHQSGDFERNSKKREQKKVTERYVNKSKSEYQTIEGIKRTTQTKSDRPT